MEDVVGKLLRKKNDTIAIYEDLTGGLVGERLQQASPDHFLEGIIGNTPASERRLLDYSRRSDSLDRLSTDPAVLANELARAVRGQAEADLGLAVHGVRDPGDDAENLARGQTFISITDGESFKSRTYNMAGRGRPDRTRMSMNAMDLVRSALLVGI